MATSNVNVKDNVIENLESSHSRLTILETIGIHDAKTRNLLVETLLATGGRK